jgi:RHS repeat-associated protein
MGFGKESMAGGGQLRVKMAFASNLQSVGMRRGRGRLVALLRIALAVLAAAAVVVPGCGGGSVSSTKAPQASAPSFASKLRVVPGLAEPLVTTKATTDAEDRAVAEATESRDGVIAPLVAFRAAHPDSGWNAAIDTNLGLAYYRQGFFSKAIASFEAAWKEGRAATDFRAKTLVDRAVGELARMHARLGHLAQLDALVADLDLTSATDRLGETTTYAYDANRQLVSVTDPLFQVTKYAYDEAGTLKSITDANNNATTWDVDIERRPVAKHDAKGTGETYAYENATGRLKSKTDALQQVTSYAYNLDDTVAGITYTGTGTAPPAAPVSFTYDPVFPRRTSMTDGVGTTTYSYYPIAATPALGAGRLQFVASPVAGAAAGAVDVVSYAYDELGRVAGRSVNGSSRGVTFDALGRPKTVTNALDAFTYGYSDETARVTSVTSLHGPKVALRYYDATGHPEQNELLQQMTYTVPTGSQVLAQFGYEYDANSQVKTFTETHLTPRVVDPDGGAMGTLQARRLKGPGGRTKPPYTAWRSAVNAVRGLMVLAAALLVAAMFGARRGKRRLAFAVVPLALGLMFAACGGDDNSTAPPTDAGSDAQLDAGVGTEGGGDAATGGRPDAGGVLTTRVTGYKYDAAGRLVSATLGAGGMPPAPSGTPQFAYAYDRASNLTTIAASGATQSPTYTNTNEIIGGNYDPNGSPKTLAGAQYAWDAANRLVSATVGGIKSELTYDGLSRLVRIVTTQGAATIADKAYTWSGGERVLERDNSKSDSAVSKQYFAQGVVAGGIPSYYAADQLGSVRQLVDASGAVRAQYDYDPYGNRTKLDGDANSDLGFTGFFHHASAGLDLALFRSYNAQQGRWLNRDPIGEAGGVNLYGYVGGNPVSNTDPSGEIWWTLGGAAVGAGLDIAYQMHTKGCVSWGQVGNAALIGSGLGGLAEGLAARFAARVAAEAIAEGTSVLEQASSAAFKAAENADAFTVGAKHLAGSGGRWAQFAEGTNPNALLQEALSSPGARFLPNDATSFKVVTDLGRGARWVGVTTKNGVPR